MVRVVRVEVVVAAVEGRGSGGGTDGRENDGFPIVGGIRGSEEELFVFIGPLVRNNSDRNVVVSEMFGPLSYRSNNYA